MTLIDPIHINAFKLNPPLNKLLTDDVQEEIAVLMKAMSKEAGSLPKKTPDRSLFTGLPSSKKPPKYGRVTIDKVMSVLTKEPMHMTEIMEKTSFAKSTVLNVVHLMRDMKIIGSSPRFGRKSATYWKIDLPDGRT